MTYKLYWYAGSAAMAPHAILHDIGVDFELIHAEGAFLKSNEFKKINPNGAVPVLVLENGETMYESTAICQYLAERHPGAKLCPSLSHPSRAQYLQWMVFLTNTVQEAMTIWWHPEKYTEIEEVRKKLILESEERLARHWQFLDGHLAQNGPHLCGEQFYACDYYLAMLIRWTREMQKPGEHYPHLNKLVHIAMARPAYQKMLADQGIMQNKLPLSV